MSKDLGADALKQWEDLQAGIRKPPERHDSYKTMMRELIGADDAPDSVGWLSAEQATDRERVRRFFEDASSGDLPDPCGSGYGSELWFEGQHWSQVELKDEMHRRAYNLIRAGWDVRTAAAECHLTVEEAEKLKQHFRL